MLRLRNELSINPDLISPRSVAPQHNSISFVPFLNERDSLGRLIGITPRRYEKRELLVRNGDSKKQLLSEIYQDSKTQQSISAVSKTEEVEAPSGMDFWRSEVILPRIKKSDFSLGELKINKASIKSRSQNKNSINSARDLPERIRIPPIGFYDVSGSIQCTKERQKAAIIFEEHRKARPTDLEIVKEAKENKLERLQGSISAKNSSNISGIKTERHMRIIDNKPKQPVAQKDSAQLFVDKRSYFKRLKSREDEDLYAKYHQAMNHKFNEMREKLNMLKGSINQE